MLYNVLLFKSTLVFFFFFFFFLIKKISIWQDFFLYIWISLDPKMIHWKNLLALPISIGWLFRSCMKSIWFRGEKLVAVSQFQFKHRFDLHSMFWEIFTIRKEEKTATLHHLSLAEWHVFPWCSFFQLWSMVKRSYSHWTQYPGGLANSGPRNIEWWCRRRFPKNTI